MTASRLAIFALLGLVAGVIAHPSHVERWTRLHPPAGWKKTAGSVGLVRIRLALAMTATANAELLQQYWARSTPAHVSYGKWLTKEEIDAVCQPLPSSVGAVRKWLHSAGLGGAARFVQSDLLEVHAPAHVLARAFRHPGQHTSKRLQWGVYEHVGRPGVRVVAALGSVWVPNAVHQAVNLITGLSDFPPPHFRGKLSPQRRGRQSGQTSSDRLPLSTASVVPQVVWNTYGINPANLPNASVSQAAIAFQNAISFNKTSLALFDELLALDAPTPITKIIGNYSLQSGANSESTLDVQYMTSTGLGSPSWFWTEHLWMFDFAVALTQSENPPDVVSMSYAWFDSDQCAPGFRSNCSSGESSERYMNTTNRWWVKAGLRGISLLSAAGDFGAYGDPDPGNSVLNPYYPASSPFVWAVGASALVNLSAAGGRVKPTPPKANHPLPPPCHGKPVDYCGFSGPFCAPCATSATETAADGWGGGGFSSISRTPAYQQTEVDAYLKSMAGRLPNASTFKSGHRGYPDASSLGSNYMLKIWGQWSPQGGTSASTPVWAGIVTNLNRVRVAAGKSTLGPLHTMFYEMARKKPATFTDITTGDNIDNPSASPHFPGGFYAAKGWDPVTGLGTPNVPEMMQYIRSLP